jgi:hypothetical protein
MTPLRHDIRPRPTYRDANVAALDPAEIGEPLPECCKPRLRLLIGLDKGQQHADAPHAGVLLRPRRQRPRRSRAAKTADKLAPLHDRPPVPRSLRTQYHAHWRPVARLTALAA